MNRIRNSRSISITPHGNILISVSHRNISELEADFVELRDRGSISLTYISDGSSVKMVCGDRDIFSFQSSTKILVELSDSTLGDVVELLKTAAVGEKFDTDHFELYLREKITHAEIYLTVKLAKEMYELTGLSKSADPEFVAYLDTWSKGRSKRH